MRVFAIDWSGARDGGRKKIWLAESSNGHLRDLSNGRSRDEVADLLVAMATEDSDLVVGFDFAFSAPEWFVRQNGAGSGPEFWEIAEQEGKQWLSECPPPFFGRAGTKRTEGVDQLRRTDREVPKVKGRAPSSFFQIAGGSQVGTGSIRGMPILRRLTDEGFRVWPFHEPAPGSPLVVEIYPRLLTGPLVKTSGDARERAVRRYANQIGSPWADIAIQDEDQYDAAVSSAVMNRHLHELAALPPADEVDRLEGKIWYPTDPTFTPGDRPADYLDPELPSEPFAFVYEGGLDDGPFDPGLAKLMEWGDGGRDGTVALPTAGTPRYLRVLDRDGDRVFTADGIWISLVPIRELEERERER